MPWAAALWEHVGAHGWGAVGTHTSIRVMHACPKDYSHAGLSRSNSIHSVEHAQLHWQHAIAYSCCIAAQWCNPVNCGSRCEASLALALSPSLAHFPLRLDCQGYIHTFLAFSRLLLLESLDQGRKKYENLHYYTAVVDVPGVVICISLKRMCMWVYTSNLFMYFFVCLGLYINPHMHTYPLRCRVPLLHPICLAATSFPSV